MAAALVWGALRSGFIKVIGKLTHVLCIDCLMDKIHTEASQREREDQSATTTSTMMNLEEVGREFERRVIDEGNQIRERIKLLFERASHLRLNQGVPNRPLQRLTAPFVGKESDVVGRDGDKEKIIELLLSDDTRGKNLSVIPIVGMGGLGKTTLAQLVFEDSRVQQHFAFKVWVTVSEHFNVFQITKAIFQKVVNSQERSITELLEFQRELNNALAGKMFLFVLDDVWNDNYGQWDSLKSAFESGARGSKIIVTTRNKDVALTMSTRVMHELKLVSDDVCWRIFEKHAFDDSAEATAQLQEIGRKIVKRCKGLPLAVKSIAGLLRCISKPEGWENILNSDIWQLQFQTDLKKQVVPAVWLSYQFLPPYLKRCFAYLSIFPKDYLFRQSGMKKIIWLWMAEGLLEPEKGKKAEEVGEEYLEALIGRSFFQYSSQDESELIMHDIVHDLAMFISGEFCFEFNDSNDLSNLPTKACHLSISTEGSLVSTKIMKGLTSQTRSLRSFLIISPSYLHRPILEKSLLHDLFLKVGGCLRVLSLSESSVTELPDSIGNMKYLRYLDLSDTLIKVLPDSIGNMKYLRYLDLSRTKIKELPDSIGNIKYLMYLDLSSTKIKELPDSIGNMKYLRYLYLSRTKIKELPDSIGNMKYLRYLNLSDTSIKELPDSICTLYNLQTLLLSVCEELERLPTRLAALVNLRHLDIHGTPLKEMPPQMCKMKSLQTLSDFVLGENDSRRIKELGELPPLGGTLRISGLEYIVDVKDVLEAILKDHKFLIQLELEWGWCDSNITSSQQDREVLEALQPHTNLMSLTFDGYRGTIFPDWVGHESFCNMVFVRLDGCRNVCMLPPLGQLSSLSRLYIDNLDGVVSIGNEFCGSSSSTTNHPFTSLEFLLITNMASLEEWSFSSDQLGQEGGVFPSLTKLVLNRCKKLIVGLPDCHLPSLKSIDIEDCDEMVDVFVCQSRQEMDTNAFPSLESMSVNNCQMESLLGRHSFPSNLKRLLIWRCKKLWENRMNWGLERLPSLMTFSLEQIEEEMDSFPEEGLLPTTLIDLSIRGFKNLKGLNGRAFQHLTSLQNLNIGGCKRLECLPEEGLPLSLSCLDISGCPVLKQRCQRGTGEDWPKIQHIPKIEKWCDDDEFCTSWEYLEYLADLEHGFEA